MPTYEFYCEDCHLHFEEHMKMADATSQANCPKCTKLEHTRRVYSPPNIGRAGTSRDSVDRIVGAEAERRWVDIQKRKSEKDKLRKESGNHAVETVIKKDDSGKINYEYKSVSRERLQERKSLYSEFTKQEGKSKK